MELKGGRILLVEDNDDHAEIVLRSLESHCGEHQVRRFADGESALAYLFRQGRYSDPESSPRPTLIMLDLRLPKISGDEILRRIKSSKELQQIPVVVLTTSEAEQDVSDAYRHHANSYIVKPLEYDRFSEMIDGLRFYWLIWNRGPDEERSEPKPKAKCASA